MNTLRTTQLHATQHKIFIETHSFSLLADSLEIAFFSHSASTLLVIQTPNYLT